MTQCRWLTGCMDRHGCIDAWMNRCMDAWISGYMHGWTDTEILDRDHGCMDGSIDMDGQMMNGHMHE